MQINQQAMDTNFFGLLQQTISTDPSSIVVSYAPNEFRYEDNTKIQQIVRRSMYREMILLLNNDETLLKLLGGKILSDADLEENLVELKAKSNNDSIQTSVEEQKPPIEVIPQCVYTEEIDSFPTCVELVRKVRERLCRVVNSKKASVRYSGYGVAPNYIWYPQVAEEMVTVLNKVFRPHKNHYGDQLAVQVGLNTIYHNVNQDTHNHFVKQDAKKAQEIAFQHLFRQMLYEGEDYLFRFNENQSFYAVSSLLRFLKVAPTERRQFLLEVLGISDPNRKDEYTALRVKYL